MALTFIRVVTTKKIIIIKNVDDISIERGQRAHFGKQAEVNDLHHLTSVSITGHILSYFAGASLRLTQQQLRWFNDKEKTVTVIYFLDFIIGRVQ